MHKCSRAKQMSSPKCLLHALQLCLIGSYFTKWSPTHPPPLTSALTKGLGYNYFWGLKEKCEEEKKELRTVASSWRIFESPRTDMNSGQRVQWATQKL
ncbi:hypothetical protein Bpfe_021572 [Biomphalaria pfeifferi]|uniref:Uncharacterized protein n=1 Tax=Biomphalaria pfeifferi TaxID=112525 RepID=A0AAD8B6L5_BIOPF|nr:hypothetical protein Bpfe_021572 [Biomphalaria pfeifferi]